MSSLQFRLKNVRQEITENHLQLKAIIQDINKCTGPITILQALNSEGRSKIAILRKLIDEFSDTVKENKDKELLKEVVLAIEQLNKSMEIFKQANQRAIMEIDKCTRDQLLLLQEDKNNNKGRELRQRIKHDTESMVKMSTNVTDQLLNISKQLSDTTQKSAQTLETLITSSQTVLETREELKMTSGVIGQSGKLLDKYGRRDFTDKIILFIAFAFFVSCVIYIIPKRLL